MHYYREETPSKGTWEIFLFMIKNKWDNQDKSMTAHLAIRNIKKLQIIIKYFVNTRPKHYFHEMLIYVRIKNRWYLIEINKCVSRGNIGKSKYFLKYQGSQP